MNNDIKKYTTPNGNTRYKFLIYVGKDETTGNTIQIKKQGFKTKQDAMECYLNYKLKVVKGEYVPITKRKLRLRDLYKMWLKLYKRTVQESTLATTEKIFNNHVLKDLGNIYLNKLTVAQCQNAVELWYKQAPKTFRRFVFYASKLINYGVTMELIKKNPMKKVILPKLERDNKKFDSFYSKEELNIFLRDAKQYNFRYFMFFRLLAYSGMRKGECLALKWSDIDFKRKTIDINKSLACGENNRLYLSPCKTKSSVRTLDMDQETMDYLEEWRLKQRREMFKLGINFLSDDNLIFANSKGTYTVLSKPQRWDNAICKEYGLRHIKVHGFRHTHASLLFDAGASMKDVKERLGHSNIATTMNIYTHVTENKAKETANNFAKFMES